MTFEDFVTQAGPGPADARAEHAARQQQWLRQRQELATEIRDVFVARGVPARTEGVLAGATRGPRASLSFTGWNLGGGVLLRDDGKFLEVRYGRKGKGKLFPVDAPLDGWDPRWTADDEAEWEFWTDDREQLTRLSLQGAAVSYLREAGVAGPMQ